ncbi:hypothetical protein HCN44_005102 [Aphidius gifuensis]|uniref:AAA+ ATPase domain-containing protein n=1 Tax=Aphidius gifuensis TaxID=684658 RepID=A0A834XSQ3_APHGI|nr:ATPase WRNIP1-like [Aphidius gifuensis]KAF7992758.1 hypothetical protein HCN44_005102 [Aphidius gifuensis]
MEYDKGLVPCPICSKEFTKSSIETHASKCLFFNESTSSNSSQKFSQSPTVNKKSKQTFFQGSQKASSSSTNKNHNFINNDVINKPGVSQTIKLADNNQKNIQKNTVPLAERMRPNTLENYVGQVHALGKESMLLQLFMKYEIPNIIIWGPPGCGKTSLANVIANICKQCPSGKLRYVKLSAAMCGVAEVKESANIAANDLKFGRKTVIFMDEIHRFNKAQQDIFLPHIEAGTITLVGATTENPSFSLNSALLSRCRVIVLEKLTTNNLKNILTRAVASLNGIINNGLNTKDIKLDNDNLPKFIIDERTIDFLAETCDGDARIALGGLELTVQSKTPHEDELSCQEASSITLEDVKDNLKKTHMLYDRNGEQHYDIISAFHKSIRASEENAALYWLARMMAGGEDPVYIARRMVRMASEDIGLEDPKALSIAVQTMQACKMIGMPDCDVNLSQCATYLARAPKSRLMEDSLRAAQRLVAEHKGPQPSVPLHLRNAPTKLMSDLGYGKGYNMKHHSVSQLTYLPEGLEHVSFF